MWICDKDEHCIDCPKNYPNEECEHYIEVQVIKHGRWIDTGSGQECSVCGEIQYGYDSGRHYCPNCGAKMDKDNTTQYTECVVNLYPETKLRFVLDECIEDEKLIEKILKALDEVEE